MHDVDAGDRFEELRRQERRAAEAAGPVVELARPQLGISDQLRHRVGGNRRVHDQLERRRVDHGDPVVLVDDQDALSRAIDQPAAGESMRSATEGICAALGG